MSGRSEGKGFDPRSFLDEIAERRPQPLPIDGEADDEESCPAFGYLRGIRDYAPTLELRFRDGNREWYPYSLLSSCRYNPSVGILLRFTGDVVTLVLIRGSNLDAPVNHGSVNLIDRGLGRHRVVWIREMDETELRRAAKGEPTIDGIEVAEFESSDEMREWLEMTALPFFRGVP